MIIVLGTIFAREETFEELRAMAMAHTERSRGEPGCISHDVAVDCHDPLKLTFVEKWKDRAALAVHFQVKASIELVAKARGLSAKPPVIEIFEASPAAM